ncbi:MAG: hypothetical protein ACFFDN_35480 [Candidatus Hodarchaeota archaeon]
MQSIAYQDSTDQNIIYHDNISISIFFLYIGSIFIVFSTNFFTTILHQCLYEIIKVIMIFINMWGLGYLVNDIVFSPNSKRNIENKKDINSNSNRFILRYFLVPIAFGIITIYFFSLIAIILLNFFDIRKILQRKSIIFSSFYIIEIAIALIFIYSNKLDFKSLLTGLKYSLSKFKASKKLSDESTPKIWELIVFLVLSLTIFIISIVLGEINYNLQPLNVLLVYLFFLAIIVNLIFYMKLSNRPFYLDIALISIIVFSLAHLFISRGPTLVGRTDIHKEYFYAQYTFSNIDWDPNEFTDNYNTVISISIFPMILSLVFGIKIESFFELVSPIFFSLFNISNYLIIRKLYSRYNNYNPTLQDTEKRSSSFVVIFSFLIIIFIRSYTHLIAASSRIVIAYFLFIVFCLLLAVDRSYYGSKQMLVLLILLLSVLFSHWGTFIFGIAIIIASLIFYTIYDISLNYNLHMIYPKIIKRKLFKIYLFIGFFTLLVILWLFFIAPKVMTFIGESIFSSIEEFLTSGIDNFLLQISSLAVSYRIFDLSNPIIIIEVIINLSFIFLLIISNLSKLIKILNVEKSNYFDFFGISSILCMSIMFLIPVLSSFYNPMRIGMQFWPFIAPIFFLKVSFDRIRLPRLNLPNPRNIVSKIRITWVLSGFLFIVLLFHQGIVYDIVYNLGNTNHLSPLEVEDSMSLVFRNYGVEAWRWVLTEYDLYAIEWLDLQSPVSIYADLSRVHMLFSRINGTPPEEDRISYSILPLKEFYKTNNSEHIYYLRASYFFFSSQNIDSGLMFFSNKGYNTSKLILQLEEFNASLVYSNRTLIYYLPDY